MNEILNNIDLYGYNVLKVYLQKTYNFVSVAKNSVPKLGSPTFPTSKMNAFNDKTKVIRIIKHRNKNITIVTNFGYFQFFN